VNDSNSTTATPPAAVKRPHAIRRLYDWTIRWAERPHGVFALFLLAFAESSFFPIPPDVLLIALCVAASTKSFRFALVCTTGSVLGGLAGYGIGYWGYEAVGDPIVRFYHGEEVMAKIKTWYDEYGFWGNLAAAITPIPYKVFTIASGVFNFDFLQFTVASVVGRGLRFFVVAGLIFWFGPRMKAFIEKYFDLLAIAGMILLIGGFVLLKYLK
jgi:membrane protein YqaA with SNARE-associated domain